MLGYQPVSSTVQAIEQIINILQEEPGVKAAAVSTLDGIPITSSTTVSTQMAAAAGFLLASAHQINMMLGCQPSAAITIQTEDDSLLVCQPFKVDSIALVLTVIFNRPLAYKRLLNRTIRAICQTLEV